MAEERKRSTEEQGDGVNEMKTLRYELTIVVEDTVEHGEVTESIDRAFNQRLTFIEILPHTAVDFKLVEEETV